jgi:hypothetical protein
MFMPRLNNFGGKRTALFNVNTDARDHEVPNLSWDGEIKGRNACLIGTDKLTFAAPKKGVVRCQRRLKLASQWALSSRYAAKHAGVRGVGARP